jgi:hypothetical protein
MLVSNLSGKPIESQEETRTPLQSVFFRFRCLMSLVILALAFTVTLAALFQGKTTTLSVTSTSTSQRLTSNAIRFGRYLHSIQTMTQRGLVNRIYLSGKDTPSVV